MEQTLEKPTARKSPLLSDAVIERDYTQGIESQIDQPKVDSTPPPDAGQQTATGEPQQNFNTNFSAPESGPEEQPKGFSFDNDIQDESDIPEGEAAGFDLSSTSAKQFANITGDVIKTQIPKMVHDNVKVDIPNIRYHVNAGNIDHRMLDAFVQVNDDIFNELQWSDDEIKMWKKAFQAWLEEKNIAAANATTGLIMASLALGVPMFMKAKGIKKSINAAIMDAIKSHNPSYFETFGAKYSDAPKEDHSPTPPQPEQEQSKTDKTTM